MADTGVDEHTARAMVADVHDQGSDSPHAEVVAAAANAILAPIIEVFSGFFAAMARAVQAWAEAVGQILQPWIAAIAALENGNDDGGDSPCTFPDAHDATQCNGYHLDASDL
jgi:hypothetical protein